MEINKRDLSILLIGLVVGGLAIGLLDANRPQPIFSDAAFIRNLEETTIGEGEPPPLPGPTVSKPVISPDGSLFHNSQIVIISDSTPGAVIRYTTNGSVPTETSAIAPSSFWITSATTFRARAFKAGMNPSQIATAIYAPVSTLPQGYLGIPLFDPTGGTYSGSVRVRISNGMPGVTFRYTTDGTRPTETSPIYSPATNVTFTTNTTLKARAFKEGYTPSYTATTQYFIQ